MFLDCNNPKLTPHERELCRKMAAKAARENADKTATELYAARDPRCLPDLHHHCGSGRPVMPPGVYAPERYARGEAHGLAKLDEKQVAAIRRSDDSYANLARKFGCSAGNIFYIRHRETWRHVKPSGRSSAPSAPSSTVDG